MRDDTIARFWAKVDRRGADECWRYQGYVRRNGYGQHGHRLAHRLAYELLVGPIPAGLTIDHLCRNRVCANPAHLEAVSNRENLMRGVSLSAQNARKTHCQNGHPLTGDNLRVRVIRGRDARDCRTCLRVRDRVWRQTVGRELRRQQQARWRAKHGDEYNARRREARRQAA